MYDGQVITYTGEPRQGVRSGDQGKALVISPTYVHVMFHTGAAAGQVVMCDRNDLESARRDEVTASLDDSLEFGFEATAAQDLDEGDGVLGVVASLDERGYLAPLSDAADEAIALVASRVRQDHGIRQVLAGLDADSGELVIQHAAMSVLRDALQDD